MPIFRSAVGTRYLHRVKLWYYSKATPLRLRSITFKSALPRQYPPYYTTFAVFLFCMHISELLVELVWFLRAYNWRQPDIICLNRASIRSCVHRDSKGIRISHSPISSLSRPRVPPSFCSKILASIVRIRLSAMLQRAGVDIENC
jgi:hypothetical protein